MEAVSHVRKLVFAGALVASVALLSSGPAFGKGCPGTGSDPSSSVAQYVEQIPTSCGQKATGTGNTSRPIPKSIENKIDSQGGDQATLLKEVVSNSSYGAPDSKIKPKKTKSGKGSTGRNAILSDSETRSGPLAASLGVITDGSDARLIALVGMMLAIAVIVLVSALRRRRVTR